MEQLRMCDPRLNVAFTEVQGSTPEACYDIFKLFRTLFTTYIFHTFATSVLC